MNSFNSTVKITQEGGGWDTQQITSGWSQPWAAASSLAAYLDYQASTLTEFSK